MKILKSFENFAMEMLELLEEYKRPPTKALIVGINYENTPYQLRGCINDANNLKTYFENRYRLGSVLLMTDHTLIKPTLYDILDQLDTMIENAKEGTTIWFTFSGHGLQMTDFNNDEVDGKDECLFTLDFKRLVDDNLFKILKRHSKNIQLFFLMDCCHSASNVDLEYHLQRDGTSVSIHNLQDALPFGNLVSLSGSADNNLSYETTVNGVVQGALTTTFLDKINLPLFRDHDHSYEKWTLLRNEIEDVLIHGSPPQEPHLSTNKDISEVPFFLS